MSILIKGAKPPSGCRWCYFNEDTKCALIVGCDLDGTNGTQRRKDCPLIELPDHGRLIDADKLKEKRFCTDTRYGDVEVIGVWDVNDAPTVIPAERSEE